MIDLWCLISMFSLFVHPRISSLFTGLLCWLPGISPCQRLGTSRHSSPFVRTLVRQCPRTEYSPVSHFGLPKEWRGAGTSRKNGCTSGTSSWKGCWTASRPQGTSSAPTSSKCSARRSHPRSSLWNSGHANKPSKRSSWCRSAKKTWQNATSHSLWTPRSWSRSNRHDQRRRSHLSCHKVLWSSRSLGTPIDSPQGIWSRKVTKIIKSLIWVIWGNPW